MLVVNRFLVPVEDGEGFRAEADRAHRLLAEQAGYVEGSLGRNVDDPQRWVLVTRWDGPGAYRRALSAYAVRVEAWPLLSRAIDEPSAYEPADGDTDLNDQVARSLG